MLSSLHRRLWKLRRGSACLLLGVCVVAGLQAQAGAALQVQPVGGRSTFRIGERIPLELRFTTPAGVRRWLNTASYDRSGRMSFEQFTAEPASGWTDPLGAYFAGGHVGGGISSEQELSPNPTTITLDLNEWVRFDRTGDYRVTVHSSRVTGAGETAWAENGRAPLVAEPVLLHIVPADAQWQQRALSDAVAVLHGPPPTPYVYNRAEDARRRDAIATLRFLATPAAIDELAAQVRDDRQDTMSASTFGLTSVSSALRDTARNALRKRLDEPGFPVGAWFLQTLAFLNTPARGTPEQAWQDRKRANDIAWREALAALPRKVGPARAATARTLLGQPPEDIEEEAKRQLATVLAATLPDLSPSQRSAELSWNWDRLRSSAMLPQLQHDARLPLENPGSNLVSVHDTRELKSIALRRWYELDSVGATAEAHSQIGSAHPSLTANAVSFLPVEPLPHFEMIWANALNAEDRYEQQTTLLGLLARFGTGAATTAVVQLLQRNVGSWACEPQAAVLGYVVRFSPDQAAALIERAVDARSPQQTGCFHSIFTDIARYGSGDVLNEAALRLLDSPAPRQMNDAALYLASHGRAQERATLWNHLEAWHGQWLGKGDVLDAFGPGVPETSYQARAVGEALSRALIANQAWVATQDEMQRVSAMCVGKQMCQQVQNLIQESANRNVTVYIFSGTLKIHLAQYEVDSLVLLRAKLAQYPKDTVFHLIRSSPQNSDQQQAEADVRRAVEQAGIRMDIAR